VFASRTRIILTDLKTGMSLLFSVSFFKCKATSKSNRQCDFITRSFSVLRHMMKTVKATLKKKAVSNAEGRAFS